MACCRYRFFTPEPKDFEADEDEDEEENEDESEEARRERIREGLLMTPKEEEELEPEDKEKGNKVNQGHYIKLIGLFVPAFLRLSLLGNPGHHHFGLEKTRWFRLKTATCK